jgi:hypothetical protein
MERQLVSSSNLKSVGYDPRSRTLEIEFHNGGVYQYDEVSQQTYDDLIAAASKGRYYAEHIRDHYSGRRIDDE